MMRDRPRRTAIAFGVAAGLALLGACGDDGASDGRPVAEAAAASDGSDATPAPARPQRRSAPADEPSSDAEGTGGADLTALTTDYLEGRWCGVSSTGETGPWVFHADGSHEVGIRAGDGYSMRPSGSDLDAFRRGFHGLVVQEPDRFVVYRHSYRTEFTRGECPTS